MTRVGSQRQRKKDGMATEMKKDTVFLFETFVPNYHTTIIYDVYKHGPSALLG